MNPIKNSPHYGIEIKQSMGNDPETDPMFIAKDPGLNVTYKFKDWLLDVFKVKKVENLPFVAKPYDKLNLDLKIYYAFEILKTSNNFYFDNDDERWGSFLPLMAVLSMMQKKQVCYISPNCCYASQAHNIINLYIKNLRNLKPTLNLHNRSINIITLRELSSEVIKNSNVVFMHGCNFSKLLPPHWDGKKVVQIFRKDSVRIPRFDRPCDGDCNGCAHSRFHYGPGSQKSNFSASFYGV